MLKSLFSFICLIFLTNITIAQILGYSGMEKIGDSKYLVVLDKKNHQKGERIVLLSVDEKDGFSVKKLDVKDWKHKHGKANDLESICAVPETKDEYLLVESGYWNKKYGRIFHVKYNDEKIKVLEVYHLPSISPSGKENQIGDNFEAVVCVKNDGNLFILLGERGGNERYNNGIVRIGILKKNADKIDWKTYSNSSFEAKLPKAFKTNVLMRTITDFHITNDGVLYASAAVDDGNVGPYKSLVYSLANIGFKKDELKITKTKLKQLFVVEGFKVESVSASPDFMKNSKFCIGTEDEILGGEWRALRK